MVTITKQANGDMLQYFADHPKKLKEKLERDKKKGRKNMNKQAYLKDVYNLALNDELEKNNMNKRAYLEEIYNSSFNDELEKLSWAPLIAGAARVAMPLMRSIGTKLFTRKAATSAGKFALGGAAFEGGSMALSGGLKRQSQNIF